MRPIDPTRSAPPTEAPPTEAPGAMCVVDPTDIVDPPHLVWWVAIPGGLALLAAQGCSTPFYDWWVATMHPLPRQSFMAGLLLACLPIHVFEGAWAWRRAHELGMHRSARGWALQTFLLGYPSTHLLRRRTRA